MNNKGTVINLDNISTETHIDSLYEIINKSFDEGLINSRIVKFKLDKYIKSSNYCKKLYAINKIINDDNGLETIPNDNNINEVLNETQKDLEEILAKRYIMKKIEEEVEKFLIEKQNNYIDEVKLNIIKKKKGPENSQTLSKYERIKKLDARKKTKSIQTLMKPADFSEIIGQEKAIKSLISKIASPYPQHVILYGPPGVGKTSAARLVLDIAKKLNYTPFDKKSKFVEVDGSTLRWDPREITNPLLGSVHDPIYQGSKKELSEIGVPEPKLGLVSDAHGGILFIDEIGELDDILQNKLLKVLEDKRVEFSSSYYDPDDENVPKYIKYLFEKGAPADFILIGATTKEPSEINPALRSRCVEVYFEPLTPKDIKVIVENAAKKLKIKLEDGVSELISTYTIQGRKAVNILADVYGYTLYKNNHDIKDITIKLNDLKQVISVNRYIPYEKADNLNKTVVGHINGLGVCGYIGSVIEIETAVFKAFEKGKGTIRFNETAGSMAKDSVFNAASVIRKVTDKDIKDYDVHVNVIGGGKIDGPSAGAAITVCILSALLDKPLKQDIAITGEISLRGDIKPIGGVIEKIYGAKRKGIKTVIIPKDNINEVPSDIKDIEIKPVSTIEELLKLVF